MIDSTELMRELNGSDPEDLVFFSYVEPRAVVFVQNQLGHYFGAIESVTDILIGDGSMRLKLSSLPATESGSAQPMEIVERQYPGSTETTVEDVDEDGFVLRLTTTKAYLLRKNGNVWRDGWEYEITYDRGYAEGTEPKDVRQLVIDLVGLRFATRDKGATGLQSETLGNYSYRIADFTVDDLANIPTARDTIEFWRGLVYA